jgi:phosphoribosylamine---glycine ligase
MWILQSFCTARGNLNPQTVRNVENGAACCVVLAAKGYPGEYKKGQVIHGIKEAEQLGASVFHAGTAIKDGALVTNGGRVLGVTGTGETLETAISKGYEAAGAVDFEGKTYRRDIGAKGLRGKR